MTLEEAEYAPGIRPVEAHVILTRPDDALRLLQRCPNIAVLGASSRPARAGFYVPAYLAEQGYRVIAVNPALAGQVLHGSVAVATLAEAGTVDLINVFRRAELLPGHLEALLRARPRAVWLQLGIRHDGVARALSDAGIDVVQDRCTLADHQRAGLGPPLRDAP